MRDGTKRREGRTREGLVATPSREGNRRLQEDVALLWKLVEALRGAHGSPLRAASLRGRAVRAVLRAYGGLSMAPSLRMRNTVWVRSRDQTPRSGGAGLRADPGPTRVPAKPGADPSQSAARGRSWSNRLSSPCAVKHRGAVLF